MTRLSPVPKTEFAADYEQKAHMQKSVNERYMKQLIRQFQLKFPDKNAELHCLDIGCGDGSTTVQFYNSLKELGYENLRMTGIDISEKQIATAKKKLEAIPNDNINYICADALKLDEHVDGDSFDCVFSFFTFHWIDNKTRLSKLIADSMKPNGLLFYLTVTYLGAWFHIRQELLKQLSNEPEWSTFFKDFNITPFAEYAAYEQAFSQDFNVLSSDFHEEILNYDDEKFRAFLTSWLPEIRQLRAKLPVSEQDAKVTEYLDRLLASIPISPTAAVNKSADSTRFGFWQPYGVFCGIKSDKATAEQSVIKVSM